MGRLTTAPLAFDPIKVAKRGQYHLVYYALRSLDADSSASIASAITIMLIDLEYMLEVLCPQKKHAPGSEALLMSFWTVAALGEMARSHHDPDTFH